MLEVSEGSDPTARLNALAPLAHDAGLGDLRAAGLTPKRGSITVRDLELAFGNAEPRKGEPVPTQEGALPAVLAAHAAVPGLADSMSTGAALVQSIEKLLDTRMGAAQSIHLGPLHKLLASVAAASQAAQGTALAEAATTDATAQGVGATKPTGLIQSREDAIRALQRVCEWIERNEPGHPAPLLIQRAQRLMKKNFFEIIRDLMPDGLGQIEKLAGPGRE
jgi:type VI secretion system protein ImpA